MTFSRDRLVLLTGATGAWGLPTLRRLVEHGGTRVRVLAQPARRDRKLLAAYRGEIEVVWGDMTRYDDVARAVAGVDVVLHVAALVSPGADDQPDLAWRVNVGSMQHIVRAVRARADPGSVTVVGVGSVAETGNRPAPLHWGRVGDPVRVSRFDHYGQSKVAAERVLVDSGLPRWLWLRQTGILGPVMMRTRDPIVTHAPLDDVLEWVSDEDSARLLVRLATEDLPPEVWNRVVNLGGGKGFRLTNLELQQAVGRVLGVPDIRQWYERRWFATRNFHGHWFVDSDAFNAIVPYREDTFEAAVTRAGAALPATVRMAGRVPPAVMRRAVMEPLMRKPRGTVHAIRTGDEAAITAHYGSREAYEQIGDWTTHQLTRPSGTPVLLDHGYDESKPTAHWDAADYRQTARFRGGELLTPDPATGDLATPLTWRCADGHEFHASPRLVLAAGHWCPDCVRRPEDYPRQARRNAFLAQVEPPMGSAVGGTSTIQDPKRSRSQGSIRPVVRPPCNRRR